MDQVIIEEFTELCRVGTFHSIEQWLPRVEVSRQAELFCQLLKLEVHFKSQHGQSESIESYRLKFPQFKSQIELVFEMVELPFTPGDDLLVDPYTTEPPQFAMVPVQNNPDPNQHPKKIGRFSIESELGKGGFGTVYLAIDQQLNRRVALKVPHPHLIQRASDADLYIKEARTVAGLEHPNIIPVLEVGSTPEFPVFIVSKYVEVEDLFHRLKRQVPSPLQATQWITVLTDALRVAHKQGVVHRDIKPANILVDKNDKVYLVDFGLALIEEEVGKHLPAGGSPAYMSPEQARGEGHRVDGRSDIFSLGVAYYEMLTGRRPFTGDTRLELMEQITELDPKPVRQWNESVDREWERICLRMLAKRKSDRYSSATDLLEDLQASINLGDSTASTPVPTQRLEQSSQHTGSDTQSLKNDLTPVANTPTSGSTPLKIVPKGLRSFDKNDADFFLELLPGPRDRFGLPDTISFWKSRIEETDADRTFAVGLVYGPSGCGKSSLMKAGLLPRISSDILPVYLEATPDDTERTLLGLIHKRLDSVGGRYDPSESLVALLGSIRRGRVLPANKKLLLVIDQFEQWLYVHPKAAGQPLLEALLQCDGSRLQAIVMVRDDFWMAATRFFRDLDVPLLERQNSAAVDLFDLDHAERVLKAFGRAFGKLGASETDDKGDRKQFISQAVRGLAENEKVISVRLSLFAEMMKSRAWITQSLTDVGGTTGVGVTFLEETFSAAGAPPEHRYHQTAARAVLRSLLPDAGTDIKGHQRSQAELLAASGYESKPRDFTDLMRILDGELRLITPVDRSGEESSNDPLQSSNFHYQLTHDYLVPSLRDWLTRKQRETRKGRAELKLEERTATWNTKRENKQLPTIAEWLRIRSLTDSKRWTDPQRAMMRSAGKLHGVSWGGGLVALLLIGAGIQSWVSSERWKNLQEQTRVASESLQNNLGPSIPVNILELRKLPTELALTELTKRFDATTNPRHKLAIAFALAKYGRAEVDYLVSRIDDLADTDTGNFVTALTFDREKAIAALKSNATKCIDKSTWRQKAKIAIAALLLGNADLADDVCTIENRPEPEQRTLFIDTFPHWECDLGEVISTVQGTASLALRSGVCLGVGSISSDLVSDAYKESWRKHASQWFTEKPDSSTHSAAGWLLRQWKLPIPEIPNANAIVPHRDWFVNSVGSTMVRIKGKTLDEYWVANCEVTRGQFEKFVKDDKVAVSEKPEKWEGISEGISPTDEHPAQQVSWYDAVMYCNWLSLNEGRSPSYRRSGTKEKVGYGNDGKMSDAWEEIPGTTGYRLLREAEWEQACRAGTETEYSSGSDETVLVKYSQMYPSKLASLSGSKLPNGWGLHDMHGNVWEWCFDRYDSGGSFRVSRGGSWGNEAANCRSGYRNRLAPTGRDYFMGFRLALSPSRESGVQVAEPAGVGTEGAPAEQRP